MKNSYLAITSAVFSGFLVSSVYAASDASSAVATTNDHGNAQTKIISTSGQQSDKRFHIQTFPLHGAAEVKLNFIYDNNKLKYIMIKNIGGEQKEPEIMATILGKSHVLGHEDSITLTPPNVNKIVLHIEPYSPENPKGMDALMPSKTYLFSRNKSGLYMLHTKANP